MFINILRGMLSKEMIYLILYDIVFFISNVLAYNELKQKKNKKIYIYILILVGIIIGTFGKLGIDYDSYNKIIKLNIKREYFYNILSNITNRNINLYYMTVMSLNFIMLYYIATLLKIRYKYFYISFFINFYFLDSVNIIRSIQAQLIALIGFSLYIKRKKIKGYIFFISTIFFHKTAILNLIFLFFSLLKKMTLKKIYLSMIIGLIFGNIFKGIIEHFFVESNYLTYLNTEGKDFTIRWWFLNITTIFTKIVLIFFLIFKFQKNRKFYKKYRSVIKVIIVAILLYLMLFFMDISPHVYQRIIIIIMSLNIILLPKFLEYSYLRKKDLYIYYICVLLIFILNNIQVIRTFYSRVILL